MKYVTLATAEGNLYELVSHVSKAVKSKETNKKAEQTIII